MMFWNRDLTLELGSGGRECNKKAVGDETFIFSWYGRASHGFSAWKWHNVSSVMLNWYADQQDWENIGLGRINNWDLLVVSAWAR